MHRAHHSTVPKWCHPCQREALPLFHLIDPHLHRKTFSWMGKLKIQIVSHVNAATAKSDLCKVWSFFLFDFPISRFNWSFFWMEQKSPAADACHGLLYSCTVQHHTSNLHSLAKCANCDLICWAWKLPFHNHQPHMAHAQQIRERNLIQRASMFATFTVQRLIKVRIRTTEFLAVISEQRLLWDDSRWNRSYIHDFTGLFMRNHRERRELVVERGKALLLRIWKRTLGRKSVGSRQICKESQACDRPTFSPIIIIIVWPCFIP